MLGAPCAVKNGTDRLSSRLAVLKMAVDFSARGLCQDIGLTMMFTEAQLNHLLVKHF